MPALRLSLRLPSGTAVEQFRSAAILAERTGFDQIWTGNDLFRRSGIVPVTVALDATERINVGSSVLNPVSIHPAEIAMLAANLQELSGGRYLLGIGAGSEVFLRWAGLDPAPPVPRTSSAIIAIRALLAGDAPADIPGAGDGWAPAARLVDGQAAPTPIYLGAMGPRMLTMGGRLADGVLALCLPPERLARIAELVALGERDRADGLGPVDLACAVWVSIDDDPAVARALLAERIAHYAGSLSAEALRESGQEPERFARVHAIMADGRAADAIAAVDDAMLGIGIAGTADAVVDRCLELVQAGATHLSFGHPLGRRPLDAIALLGDRVIRPLRSEVAR